MKNCRRQDYPYLEMLKHHLPLADEIIVNEGHSDDGTFEAISSLDPKIKVFQTNWHRPHGEHWWIHFKDESRRAYVRIIEKLAQEGCDAVALVCTEIPLLITAEVSPLPILDSTRLLVRAAIDVAVGTRAMPDWRGGLIGRGQRDQAA